MSDPTRLGLADGADLLDLTAEQLWWRYAGLGGLLDPPQLAALIADRDTGTPLELDLAAQAMNEAFLDAGVHTFPVGYSGRVVGTAQAGSDAVGFRTRRAAAMIRAHHLQVRAEALLAESARLTRRMAIDRRCPPDLATTMTGARPAGVDLSLR